MLVINPDECIDCGVCEPECPAEAIISDTSQNSHKDYTISMINGQENGPVITEKKDALPVQMN